MSKPRIVGDNEAALLPPHSLESEQGILGCIMLDPEKCLAVCQEKIKVGYHAFYDLRHQQIYEAIAMMTAEGTAIDTITLFNFLKGKNCAEGVGGAAYLSSLQDCTPSAMNIHHYVEIVLEKWRLRKLIDEGQSIINKVREGAASSLITAASMETLTGAFAQTTQQASILDLTRGSVDRINDIHSGRAKPGIPCGIRSIDKIIRGFGGELVVIAARPSMGKTAALISIMMNIAKDTGDVGIISCESTAEQINMRMISSEAFLNMKRIQEFDEDDFRRLTTATAKIGRMPMQVHHDRAMTINQVCSTIIGWTRQRKLKAVGIDHLRLIKGTKEHWSEKDRISEITERLSMLRSYLGIPIFLAAQLNRDVESSDRPKLHHLEGSSSIEQDADVVILLHQDGQSKVRSRLPTVDALAIIEKRRDGETGDAPIVFHRYCGRVEDQPLQPVQQDLLGVAEKPIRK